LRGRRQNSSTKGHRKRRYFGLLGQKAESKRERRSDRESKSVGGQHVKVWTPTQQKRREKKKKRIGLVSQQRAYGSRKADAPSVRREVQPNQKAREKPAEGWEGRREEGKRKSDEQGGMLRFDENAVTDETGDSGEKYYQKKAKRRKTQLRMKAFSSESHLEGRKGVRRN